MMTSSELTVEPKAQVEPAAAPQREVMYRHSVAVRLTHWINALSFLALAVSGAAILLAHPRFYWGETGYFDTPAAIELPLKPNLDQSGWGRSLHFLAAWIAVVNGLIYVAWGLISGHFRHRLLTMRTDSHGYSVLQRIVYLSVVFGLLPRRFGRRYNRSLYR